MHIDYKVIDAIRIGHLWPAGTVQHLNTELVVILYGLYDKIATHIVALVGLVEEFHAIIIAFDGRGLVRPELGKVLQEKKLQLTTPRRCSSHCLLTMSSSEESNTMVCAL